MREYIRASREAYEQTAEEFQAKKDIRLKADSRLADLFKTFLKDGDSVLELGTGSGQLSRLLGERNLIVDAIEYSPKMASLAQLTAAEAYIIVDEFLDHDFGPTKYSGIIGVAFVHLFNAEDAKQVMAKASGLLVPEGLLMLSTTIHNQTYDDIVKKTNFKTEVHRFRRHYTLQDFEDLFTGAGFKIKSETVNNDREVAGKRWANILGVKSA